MPKVKICGLKRKEDIDIVNKYLPYFVGFVFANSKQNVTKEQAKELIEMLDKRILPVGVFVNASIDEIADTIKISGITAVQLHGNEDSTFIKNLKRKIPIEIFIIKAIRVKDLNEVNEANKLKNIDYVLFDTFVEGLEGGSGKTFDWDLIKGYKKPYFLAGGLNIDNIKTVKEKLNPYCVDISSGVETEGFKDEKKIKEFMEASYD